MTKILPSAQLHSLWLQLRGNHARMNWFSWLHSHTILHQFWIVHNFPPSRKSKIWAYFSKLTWNCRHPKEKRAYRDHNHKPYVAIHNRAISGIGSRIFPFRHTKKARSPKNDELEPGTTGTRSVHGFDHNYRPLSRCGWIQISGFSFIQKHEEKRLSGKRIRFLNSPNHFFYNYTTCLFHKWPPGLFKNNHLFRERFFLNCFSWVAAFQISPQQLSRIFPSETKVKISILAN